MAIRWTTAILDYPAEEFDRGSAFWQAVTASGISGPAGERAEFVTLLPADGDPFLCARRLHGGAPGCHLDVHADDVPACADSASQATTASGSGQRPCRGQAGRIASLISCQLTSRPAATAANASSGTG